MFREMRRNRQELSVSETEKILHEASAGVLAVLGDDGYPYAVPLSYVYEDGKIYVHSAVSGHKIDAIRQSEKVSFCVISQDDIVPERFTTHFKSVIAFGRARILTEEEEIINAMKILTRKYSAEFMDLFDEEYKRSQQRLLLIEIAVDHVTGKQARELI